MAVVLKATAPEPDRVPPVSPHDRPAEQFDVVVAAREQELVERLLERPDGRGDRTANGATQRASPIDANAQGPQL